MPDPEHPGKTYREANAELAHGIPVRSLVEVRASGVRLFVAWHGRDCDQTPLYWLTPDEDDCVKKEEPFANMKWVGGYPESALSVVSPPSRKCRHGHHVGGNRSCTKCDLENQPKFCDKCGCAQNYAAVGIRHRMAVCRCEPGKKP